MRIVFKWIESLFRQRHFADWRVASFLLLTAALVLNASISRTPLFEGDGEDYFLMSHALLVRGQPALRGDDAIALDLARRRTGQGADTFGSRSRDTFANLIESGDESSGFYRAHNGAMYTYHYWLYSLFNVPALAAANVFGFSPSRSFLLTNSLLILLGIFVILFKAEMETWARISLLLIFLLCGTTFYLSHQGPEVFTACFTMIGLALFRAKRPLLAALAFAAAAQQNPPVGILAASALTFWSWLLLIRFRKHPAHRLQLAREVIGAICVLAFLLQSPLFYLYNFGTPNLIAGEGWATPELISYNRLLSFYFDLDQGLIRGTPFLLFGLVAAFLFALRHTTVNKRPLVLGMALIIAGIAMAIPTLSTTTWVTVCRVYMRYAYWGAIPFWFAMVCFLENASARQRFWMLGLTILLQGIWVIGVYRLDGRSVNWRDHSWLAQQMIKNFPEHYNPNPALFTARTAEFRTFLLPNSETVFYLEHPGRISKLLYHTQGRSNWIPECAATPADLEKAAGVKLIREESGWSYLNLGQACRIGDTAAPIPWMAFRDRPDPLPASGISFKRGGNGPTYTLDNWSSPEDFWTWTDGDTASLSFLMAQPPRGPLMLTMQGVGYAPPGQKYREAAVYVNGFPIGTARFAHFSPTSIALEIPPSLVARSSGVFHVRLHMGNVASPIDLGLGVDTRKLGIGMNSMNLQTNEQVSACPQAPQ
jgi:hypothetical protein